MDLPGAGLAIFEVAGHGFFEDGTDSLDKFFVGDGGMFGEGFGAAPDLTVFYATGAAALPPHFCAALAAIEQAGELVVLAAFEADGAAV